MLYFIIYNTYMYVYLFPMFRFKIDTIIRNKKIKIKLEKKKTINNTATRIYMETFLHLFKQ